MTKYRTIVADPPWRYKGTVLTPSGQRTGTPYGTMTIEEIAALPVSAIADKNAHLYMWTTNTHIPDAWRIVEAWGFKYSTLLTWCKPPQGMLGGAAYGICTEHVLFARKGTLPAQTRLNRNWWEWSRGRHSAKPDAFLDYVEQVSPGPYVELFARRARFGWDYWGNESLGTATLGEAA